MHEDEGAEKKTVQRIWSHAPQTHKHVHVKLIIKRTGLSYFHKASTESDHEVFWKSTYFWKRYIYIKYMCCECEKLIMQQQQMQ